MKPSAARLQKERPAFPELPLGVGIGEGRRIQPVENAVPFPIALRVDIVKALEQSGALAEDRIDLGLGPDIELAFLMLAVGVEAAGEPSFLGQHFATDPFEGLLDPLQIKRAAGLLPHQGQQVDELGIVVEHLFEMGHEPPRIGRITGEAATQMVVDAALAHRVERLDDRVAIRRLTGPPPGSPQQLEDAGLREFRRGADAAMELVDLAQ